MTGAAEKNGLHIGKIHGMKDIFQFTNAFPVIAQRVFIAGEQKDRQFFGRIIDKGIEIHDADKGKQIFESRGRKSLITQFIGVEGVNGVFIAAQPVPFGNGIFNMFVIGTESHFFNERGTVVAAADKSNARSQYGTDTG